MKKAKKIATVAFITVLFTLTLSIELPTTQAYGHTTITCPRWGFPGGDDCYFSTCCHDCSPPLDGSYLDFWTATGVGAYYNETNSPWVDPPGVGYDEAYWDHLSATGGYYPHGGPMYCCFCINTDESQWIDDYTDPWSDYIAPYQAIYRHVTWNTSWWQPLVPDVNSVEAATLQAFYDPENPYLYAVIQTYTDPWDCITAHYP